MLVQFALETEAVNNSGTPAQMSRLLDCWERFGILVYPRRGDAAIPNAISKLEPAPRKYWQLTWEKVIKNNARSFRSVASDGAVFDWERIDTPDALAASANEFEVAVLEETRAVVLEIPDGESKCYGQVEGMRLRDIDISERFSRSEALSSAPINIGDSITDVWNQRLQQLAAYSREVVVVDQYATRVNNISGVLRLLRFLERDARHCQVTIYSSHDTSGGGPKSVEALIRAETTRFSGNGIGSVSVYFIDQSDFGKYAHDRHLRFDNSVVRIGRGMRVFEHPTVKEATDVDFHILQPGRREQKEIALSSLATVVHSFQVPVP